AILLTGIAAATHGVDPAATAHAMRTKAMQPTLAGDLFSVSTILLQSIGFCIVPQACAYVFTARSASAVRRAQMTMPLYMVMFPFLTILAYFAIRHGVQVQSPNEVFPAAARMLLPPPMVGLVFAGAALSALVVITGVCLAIGPLVSRNLVPGLDNRQQRQWSQVVMALYLALSIAGAATSSELMVTINNLYYFGITQALPGMLGILFLRRMRPSAIIAGILAGDAVAVAIYQFAIPVGGVNAGFIGLMVNLLIVFAALYLLPDRERIPIAERPIARPLEPALPGP
ncbi:MAG TPA: hypothetical protein VGM68_01320, partial [Rhizomicrobium sp.]